MSPSLCPPRRERNIPLSHLRHARGEKKEKGTIVIHLESVRVGLEVPLPLAVPRVIPRWVVQHYLYSEKRT